MQQLFHYVHFSCCCVYLTLHIIHEHLHKAKIKTLQFFALFDVATFLWSSASNKICCILRYLKASYFVHTKPHWSMLRTKFIQSTLSSYFLQISFHSCQVFLQVFWPTFCTIHHIHSKIRYSIQSFLLQHETTTGTYHFCSPTA